MEQLHDYVLFAGNTGLRPDEAWRLEFRDVEVVDDENSGKRILEIEVRGKRGLGYCKSMPGAVSPFERLRGRPRLARVDGVHTPIEPSGSSDVGGGAMAHAGTDLIFPKWQRELFKTILEEENLRLDREGRPRTAYSLRHTYISLRLMEVRTLSTREELPHQCENDREILRGAHQNLLDAAAINVVRSKKDWLEEESAELQEALRDSLCQRSDTENQVL